MTIDEAIKHAEEVANKCEFDTDWGMGNHFIDRSGVADEIKCGEEHRQLAEWLKDYKRLKEQEPKWIPVSERLPSGKTEDYLACCSDDYISTIMYDADNGRWLIDGTEVVAWMPLPEPWKGKKRK